MAQRHNPAVPVDLTHLTWSLSRSSTGTAGSFLKSYEEIDGQKIYYKMSNYDSVRGVIGHESINEIVAQISLHGSSLSLTGIKVKTKY